MSYSITPTSGINLDDVVQTNPSNAGTGRNSPCNGPLGSQVFGSDGLRYVLGQAGAAITASTATCSINASTFVVTASGWHLFKPSRCRSFRCYAWFSKASV
jgi:hypothetical protein